MLPKPLKRWGQTTVAEAGTVVGVAGISERPRGLCMQATMPFLLCLIAWDTFEGVVRRTPEVGLRLLRVLGERIGVLETRLGDLAYKEVPARLASAILRLVEEKGVMGPQGERLTLPATPTRIWQV